MNKRIYILFFFFFNWLSAQEKGTESVYFEFDKFDLNPSQINTIKDLLHSSATPRFDAIQLYGYCDDRGSENYNYNLSNKRVAKVQEILLDYSISQNQIYICEGKGRVIINKDTIKNLDEIRDKNRRVDLIFIKNTTLTSFPASPKLGDLIVLDKVVFEMGSSVLTLKAKKELEKVIASIQKFKSIRFEIKGHVCCTSSKYLDAIDNETDERNLSINRAKRVFSYLRSKGINPYRMSFKGFGNRFPLGKGDEFDRRVEFLITRL
ncbi:OmpA family protein [Flavobacterium sp.]|uniref:OmpA family protein n=1 Tax=Flavobacterium sp. TaxID=239 RepID=UPI0038FC3653